ncbi:MAG TPA: RDD family protein [Polyangia bacterium]|jgi:uncharacterized RDD family membrane protein YckC
MTTTVVAAGARAGFVTRLGAFVVDAAILSLGIRGTIWLLDVNFRVLRRFALPVSLTTIVLFASPVIVALYDVVFWRLWGRTPGKWLLGLRVVALGGGRVGVGQALLRVVGYLVSALPFYLGFLWILGPRRLGFHDHLARTEVVRASYGGARSTFSS